MGNSHTSKDKPLSYITNQQSIEASKIKSGTGSWSSLIVQGFEIRVYSGDGEPAVCIQPEGTGDHNSGVSEGVPVVVEFCDGKPRVHVWADINQEDSTHTSELDGALESKRAAQDVDETTSVSATATYSDGTAVSEAEIVKPNYENLYRNAINDAKCEGNGLLVVLLEYALRMYHQHQ